MRIGIDLGGTTVKAALCTEDGTLLCKDSLPTRTGNAAGLKADMKTLALSLCRAHRCAVEDVTAIGIGVPGSFDKKTCTLRFGTNLDLNNVSFADAFLPEFGCPVHLDNDANCAALGEATAGAAKGTRNMLMVTLGTGVGGGIIINGQLYTGWTNDPAARLRAHRSGRGARYTRAHGAEGFAYLERCADRCAALRREAALKKLPKAQKELLCAAWQAAGRPFAEHGAGSAG